MDLGPIIYSYAHNDYEGNRFRLGFRTTPAIEPQRGDCRAYVAYGTARRPA
ncbi:MAG: hypothetical protein WKG07_22915 [Hymenobacter sp.]